MGPKLTFISRKNYSFATGSSSSVLRLTEMLAKVTKDALFYQAVWRSLSQPIAACRFAKLGLESGATGEMEHFLTLKII